MQGIREIYVSDGKVDDYFDYAARVGMESDLTAVSRDSLSFARRPETLPGRADRRCRQIAAQLWSGATPRGIT